MEVVQQVRACRDPHDDQFLEAAVSGRADVIIAGDEDLRVCPSFPRDRDRQPGDDLSR